MKLGVFTVPLYDRTLEDALAYLSKLGVECVELGCGAGPGKTHLDPDIALSDSGYIPRIKELLKKYNMTISALSCHGNPVHPNPEYAKADHDAFVNAARVAEMLELDTVITFGGCPGDSPGAKYANWVTCAWPTDFTHILKYQWEDVLIPYWTETAKVAKSHGVTKIALEMHPGFAIYNPRSLLRLREAVGDAIGANFDPSHLFWQGINPTEALKVLKGAIYHFHAKDTRVDPANTAKFGVLDTSSYGNILDRAWLFRTVGYGNGESVWRDMISTLRAIGYTGAISIEHEDALMSIEEGLEKAIQFLQPMLIRQPVPEMWWV